MYDVVVFSKHRPLQLHAHLESMLHFATTPPDTVFVLSPDEPIPWDGKIKWKSDGKSFDAALRDVIDRCSEYILLSIDDFIYIREWSFLSSAGLLEMNPDILCVAYRLGLNIRNSATIWRDADTCKMFDYVKWRWSKVVEYPASHWSYQLGISGTVFRKETILKILEKRPFRYPGDLEIHGIKTQFDEEYLAMPIRSCCVGIHVNKVHECLANKHVGKEEHSVESLRAQYDDGKRLDWRRLSGMIPSEPGIDDLQHWVVHNDPHL